ncbi:MAG: hypothetical protein KIT69_07015 [Propionibacteriaceae bacterium]|nr:hypothetical protein [Propionibacteriaceae bacterium]
MSNLKILSIGTFIGITGSYLFYQLYDKYSASKNGKFWEKYNNSKNTSLGDNISLHLELGKTEDYTEFIDKIISKLNEIMPKVIYEYNKNKLPITFIIRLENNERKLYANILDKKFKIEINKLCKEQGIFTYDYYNDMCDIRLTIYPSYIDYFYPNKYCILYDVKNAIVKIE